MPLPAGFHQALSEPAPSGILPRSGNPIAVGSSRRLGRFFVKKPLSGAPEEAATVGALRFGAMRWMMIAFLVSLAALLLAVAGVARHIWLQRSRLDSNPGAGPVLNKAHKAAADPVEEIDQEIEL
jgi:hypothetical protein